MSELLNSICSRIESLGIGFKFVKTIKTGTDGAERETWLLDGFSKFYNWFRILSLTCEAVSDTLPFDK